MREREGLPLSQPELLSGCAVQRRRWSCGSC